jgi:Zinc finger, C3HC4 type (RING finger)
MSNKSQAADAHDAANAPPGVCVVCCATAAGVRTAPCGHAVCCAVCFERMLACAPTERRRCPVCRAHVRSACSTDAPFECIKLPPSVAALAAPAEERGTADRGQRSSVLHQQTSQQQQQHDGQRSLLGSVHGGRDGPQAALHRRQHAVLVSQEAPLPASRGFEQPQARMLRRGRSLRSDRCMSSAASIRAAWPSFNRNLPVVLVVGQSSRLLHGFLLRLRDAVPDGAENAQRDCAERRSNLFVFHGMQLLPILTESGRLEQSTLPIVLALQPRLVILCADIGSVASFQGCVQCDLQLLTDAPALARNIMWVLVKSPNQFGISAKQRSAHPCVEIADILAAKHYITLPRACFVVNMDARIGIAELRNLGMYLRYRLDPSPVQDMSVPFLEYRSGRSSFRDNSISPTYMNRGQSARQPRTRLSNHPSGLSWFNCWKTVETHHSEL